MSFKRKAKVQALLARASKFHEDGDHRKCLEIIGEALKLDPKSAKASLYYGWTLAHLAQPAEALKYLQAGIKGGAKDDKVWSAVAGCFSALGDDATAVGMYRRHLVKNPHDHITMSEIATSYLSLSAPLLGQQMLRRSLALAPSFYGALNNLALVHKDFADHEQVIRLLQRSLVLRGSSDGVAKNLISSFLFFGKVPLDRYDAAKRKWTGRFTPLGSGLFRHSPRDPDPARRLKVGVLSSDFRNHPVGRNFLPVFARAESFDWHVYANTHTDDGVTTCYRGKGAKFLRVPDRTEEEIAYQIDRDRIDVMIYLAARMDDNRPQVSAFRAAPVQVSYLDVGSANMPGIGYTILAPQMAPRGAGGEVIDERVVRVPRFYQHPEGPDIPVMPVPALSGQPFTFGSFNNAAKVNEEVLKSWRRIMDATPGSRILLKYKMHFQNAEMQRHVLRYLPEGRVIFGGVDSSANLHSGAFNMVDVCLDTFNFNGSTTTFDSLWMGVPVITVAGATIMGRYGVSIMRQVRLPQFAHPTLEAYEAHAIELARNPALLTPVRAGLRESVVKNICIPKGYYFERAVRAMWRRWCLEQRNQMAS